MKLGMRNYQSKNQFLLEQLAEPNVLLKEP